MKSSWLWLGIAMLTLAFVAGCGGAQQTPPPVEEVVEEAPAPPEDVPEQVEEKIEEMMAEEADVEPAYEEPVEEMAEEPPPPRPVDEYEPPAMEEAAPEEYVAAVEAPPQPVSAAPDFEIVYFDYDKSEIKPEFQEAIRNNARSLNDDANLVVIIEGHCDERGTTEYNLALGERRANAVRDALISEGVNVNQLDTVSYGEERPVAYGHDESSWGQNRRAAITLR
jgi:peptidoglycan-associated lipoprotein